MNRQKTIVMLLAVIIGVSLLITSCSSGSRLEGQWVCETVHSGYPDSMTLNSDGTGLADGMSISWWVDETTDEFNFSYALASHDYAYSVSGDTLYLDDYAYYRVD